MTLFETIIEEVKKYPCLWNKSLDSYRNQIARDNAWKMVSGALNTPGNFYFVCWYFFANCLINLLLNSSYLAQIVLL